MTKIQLLSLAQADKWDGYLSRLPFDQQDVYYTPEYYSLYERRGDGRAQCFVFEHGGELALYPFLINRINDLGYDLDADYYDIQGAYGYNGIVSSTSEKSFCKHFFSAFGNFIERRRIVTEFTRFHPLLLNHKFHIDHLEIVKDRTTVVLDLSSGYDNIFANQYASRNRNMIRKARKSGIEYKILHSMEAFENFIDVYYASMKRVSADPGYFFPREYFIAMAESMGDESFIVCAFEGDIMIAAALFLVKGLYCHYHLSGRADSCSDNSVSNFMIDVAIREAIYKGVKWFHLGGGRTNRPDDSLLKFKQNFSKSSSDFFIGKKVHLPDIYEMINTQWRRKYPRAYAQYSGRLQGYRIQT